MEKENLVYIFLAGIFLLGVYTYIQMSAGPGEYDQFAQCLTENNVVMYGTDWCPHCKEQKAMFGKSFQYVDYRNCDFNQEECDSAGVEGYPTWVIDGKKYPGTKSLKRLSGISGCKLQE